MARRKGASLPAGLSITDFASPARVLHALGSPSAIQAEYSRQRSIIRKRIERMAAAGETANKFYNLFGNLREALPQVKNLTTEQMSKLLASTSRAIAGGYQATLSEVRKSRHDVAAALRLEAEQEGDTQLAEVLAKDPSPQQMDKIRRLMGMIQKTVGRKTLDSGDTMRMATLVVMTSKSKTSLLTMGAKVMQLLGVDDADNLEALKDRFTAAGTTRVAWSRVHGSRGR
jgi:hypothetical protein